jgi:glutamine synthetase adenylyltransferase
MNTTARHDVPEDPLDMQKLAFLLGYNVAEQLVKDCRKYTAENRRQFNRLFGVAEDS